MKLIVLTLSCLKFTKLHIAFLFVLLSVNFNVLFAQTVNVFATRYNMSLRGDFTMISSSILNRKDDNGSGPNVSYAGSAFNDSSKRRYIEVDNDPTNFSSSSDTLTIPNNSCLKVQFAGRYWDAIYQQIKRNNGYMSLLFRTPGDATDIIFNTEAAFVPDSYACFADLRGFRKGLSFPKERYSNTNIFTNQGKSSCHRRTYALDSSSVREEVMCSELLKLTASNGYFSYVWKNAKEEIITGGDKQTLIVKSVGTYTVEKKGNLLCIDATETITVVPSKKDFKNPLTIKDKGTYLYVDNVLTCADNGSQLSEIYLCGTEAFRDLNVNTQSTEEIKWQQLDKSLEGDADSKYPDFSTENKKWITVGFNSSFRVKDAGEYRLEIVFQKGCFVRYYFNVLKTTVKPKFVGTNLNCGKNGSITISNISISLYEFSVVSKGDSAGIYSSKTKYEITKAGDYKVYYRHIGASISSCVSNEIQISDNKIDVDIKEIHFLCKKDKGEIRVHVNNVEGSYTFTLKKSKKKKGAAFETFEISETFRSINSNNYTFKNLGKGSYQVIVKTDQCFDTINNIKIKENDPLTLKALVSQHISCNKGIVKMKAEGGQKEYNYAIHSYKFKEDDTWTFIEEKKYKYQTSNVFEIPIKDAGIYKFIVSDGILCTTVSNEVQIDMESKFSYEVSKTDVKCRYTENEIKGKGTITVKLPKNLKGNTLSYALDDGIVGNKKHNAIFSDGTYVTAAFKSSKTFSELLSGDYTLVVRVKKGESICYFEEKIVITEPKTNMWGELVLRKNSCITNAYLLLRDFSELKQQGGVAPFKYSINGINYQKSRIFPQYIRNKKGKYYRPKGLPYGHYYGYIKDANGCVFRTKQLNVKKLTPPTNLKFKPTINTGSKTTDVSVGVVGGVAPFTYKIIAPSKDIFDNKKEKVFKGLTVGTYLFEVTDTNGCSYKKFHTVKSIKSISVTGIVGANVKCEGSKTGKATLTVPCITPTY